MFKNMLSKRSIAFSFALIIAIVNTTFGQSAATLSITGEVTTPLELTFKELTGFKQASLKVKDRDGKEHEFQGVALIDLLERAGATTGAKLRGENLTKYLLITAADGYKVTYSLAEVDPEFTDNVILLATTKDGQPLAAGEGPFRIIAPGQKKPARWIREVRSIKVAFAKVTN